MKKYIYIATCFLGVLLFHSSCNDMEQTPFDKFTDSNYWTGAEKAQRVVNMAYSQLYGADKMWKDECLSDNLVEGRGNSSQSIIRNGTADPSTDDFAEEWKKMYEGIKTCHVFLDKIDLVPDMDPKIKELMIIEIRYLRAAMYLRLTNLYGDVPFFTEDISLADSKTIARTPRATVVKFIHDELDEVITLLPTKAELGTDNRGKITKAAACMLQARAYLYENDYPNVEKYCAYLINNQSTYGTYSLFPSYVGLFEMDNEYNEEIIFDYSFVPSVKTWEEMYAMAPLSKGANINGRAPTQSLVDNYLMLNGKTIKEDPLYNEEDPYKNRDPRLTATVIYHGYDWSGNVKDGTKGKIIYTKWKSTPKDDDNQSSADEFTGTGSNQSPTGYYVRKYFDAKHENNLRLSTNIITMRYADVLLMYAEAMHEQSKMNQSVWNLTIKAIRARAGFKDAAALDYPTGKTKDAITEIIRNERRTELALEGLRWYDIKRWKAGTKYLHGYVYGGKVTESNDYVRLDNRKFNEVKDYLWSVPQSQMDLNGNLKPNNPGYAN